MFRRFASWNVQGKALHHFDHWYDEVGDFYDFIGLQEVSQLGSLPVIRDFTPDVHQYLLRDFDEIRDYVAIGTTSCNSHLGQVILLQSESVQHVRSAWRGDRFLAVEVQLVALKQPCIFASCHLPHSDNPDELYQESLRELVQLMVQYKHLPIILLGDFNCDPGSERAIEFFSCVQLRGGRVLRTCETTRWGRHSKSELDYFCCNSAFLGITLPDAESLEATSHPQTREELGSDHCCISLLVALQAPSLDSQKDDNSRSSKRYRAGKCKRWRVDAEKLRNNIKDVCATYATAPDIQGQWEVLTSSAQRVSMPSGTMKYVDSPALKALCLSRRLSTDPAERATLTRHIISLRHVEKTSWFQNLHQRSREGDAQAIKYLKQRFSQHKGNVDTFVETAGGLSRAADVLKNHFEHLFQQPTVPSQQAVIQQATRVFSERSRTAPSPDFTIEEIKLCIDRLRPHKTSGPSGMSNEYLISLWELDDGQQLLCDFLNRLLRADDLPSALHEAQVILIPKVISVTGPGDYRPINLLECINKVFCWLLITRLTAMWTAPQVQLGGIKGSQVCDALVTAQCRTTRDSKEARYSLYLSCDIQTAFDALDHAIVAQFLLDECGVQHGSEALQLLKLLTMPSLSFDWKGFSFKLRQGTGVQQGGSHSAIIFSYVLGLACQKLERAWRDRGEGTRHSSIILLFMDDLLLAFDSWQQAITLTEELQQVLQRLGLRLNLKKTTLMSHQSVLLQGASVSFPTGSVLGQITWSTSCTYLKKTLTHYEVGGKGGFADTTAVLLDAFGKATHAAFESLKRCIRRGHWSHLHSTIRLCNTYIGGTWYWYSPLLEPLSKYISRVRSQQVTFLTMLFGLFIPTDLDGQAAMFLHRLRRRTVLLVLNHHARSQWVSIWCRRRWMYLGHVLRMDVTALVQQEVLSLNHLKQAHPGPFHHIQQWGCNVSGRGPVALETLAQDRQAWRLEYDKHQHIYEHSHPILHPISTECWRDIFRLEVPWRLGLFVQCEGAYCSIHWLHIVEGFQTFRRAGSLLEVVSKWVTWIQLEFFGVLLDFYMHEDLLQSQGDDLQQLHDSIYHDYQFVSSFNSVSDRLTRKIVRIVRT